MVSVDLISKYFKNLTDKQLTQFSELFVLYKEWNEKINVISRKDIDFFYERHVLHSLSIAKFIKLQHNQQVLDVGTGGGFPGIPLAILFPNVYFTLTDSIGKKITVVDEVIKALGLNNIKAIHTRSEKITTNFDVIISRAVAPLSDLYGWTRYKWKKNDDKQKAQGIICLKGGDLKNEIKAVKVYNKFLQISEHNISDYFDEDFFKNDKKIVWLR